MNTLPDRDVEALADPELEIAAQILQTWEGYGNIKIARAWIERDPKTSRALVAKARELCGYAAGAAAMREAAFVALDADIKEQNCYELDAEKLRDCIRALPMPPDPTAGLREENNTGTKCLS